MLLRGYRLVPGSILDKRRALLYLSLTKLRAAVALWPCEKPRFQDDGHGRESTARCRATRAVSHNTARFTCIQPIQYICAEGCTHVCDPARGLPRQRVVDLHLCPLPRQRVVDLHLCPLPRQRVVDLHLCPLPRQQVVDLHLCVLEVGSGFASYPLLLDIPAYKSLWSARMHGRPQALGNEARILRSCPRCPGSG